MVSINRFISVIDAKIARSIILDALPIALFAVSGMAIAAQDNIDDLHGRVPGAIPAVHGKVVQMAPLGRLFFSPAERRLRELQWMKLSESQPEDKQALVSPPLDLLISGRLTRSDGHTTTWIDGHPYEDIPQTQFWSDSGNPGKIFVQLKPAVPVQNAWVGERILLPHYILKEIGQDK